VRPYQLTPGYSRAELPVRINGAVKHADQLHCCLLQASHGAPDRIGDGMSCIAIAYQLSLATGCLQYGNYFSLWMAALQCASGMQQRRRAIAGAQKHVPTGFSHTRLSLYHSSISGDRTI